MTVLLSKACNIARNLYTKQVLNFETIKSLKGSGLIETFKNVESFNKLKALKEEIKYIRGKKKKNPVAYNIRQSLFEEVKMAERLPRNERDIERARISEKAYGEILKQKIRKGKQLNKFDILGLHNETIREFNFFMKKASLLVPLFICFNGEDIFSAYKEQGFIEGSEEVLKSTCMGLFALTGAKYTSTACKNVATTASIYTPKVGQIVNFAGIFGGIAACVFSKISLDKLWQTEYEKSQEVSKDKPEKESEEKTDYMI